MGFGSVTHWLILLAIVLLIFGTKKLRNIGADLGGAVKGFKEGMKDGAASGADAKAAEPGKVGQTIDVKPEEKSKV